MFIALDTIGPNSFPLSIHPGHRAPASRKGNSLSTNGSSRPEVVVVTGAAAGLGRAIAQRFGFEGAKVGLIARDKQSLEDAKRDIEQAGGQGLVLPVDVADPDQVEAAAALAEEMLGPIDIWINVAMTSVFSPIKEMTPNDYKRVTEVNYLGYVYGTLSALKRMLPRDHGTIVQVGSALAYRGIPLQSAYCASKHAIQGFMDSLHAELLHDHSHVHATMVQMPAMNTPQFEWCKSRMPYKSQPVPPIFQPEVGAEGVYWAAHHRRREVFVGLPTTIAIIGNKIAPSLADHYLARTGYTSQQTNEPTDPNMPNNLYEPVHGNWGAHGPFDNRSHDHSLQLWETTHQGPLALAAVAMIAGAVAWLVRR